MNDWDRIREKQSDTAEVIQGDVPDPRRDAAIFKVWVSIERQSDDDYEDMDPAPVGTFDTLEEAEAFARTIGWTPFNEDNAYERGVTTEDYIDPLAGEEAEAIDDDLSEADATNVILYRKLDQMRDAVRRLRAALDANPANSNSEPDVAGDALDNITSEVESVIEDLKADLADYPEEDRDAS